MNAEQPESDYIPRLLELRSKAKDQALADFSLVFKLHAALNEKQQQDADSLSELERRCLHLCRYATNIQGIEKILETVRDSVVVTAGFAKEYGLSRTAIILEDALAERPYVEERSVASSGTHTINLVSPVVSWDATDMVLTSLAIGPEKIKSVIMDYVAEHRAEFQLLPPADVRARDASNARIAALAHSTTASALVTQLLAHRHPRMLAELSQRSKDSGAAKSITVPLQHRALEPAQALQLKALHDHYGNVVEPLLDIYRQHDGAELFVEAASGDIGFYFNPISEWRRELDGVMEWAAESAENDERAIPESLWNAIPFGQIPGDAERWLFITQGRHAGTIMLSDTDVSEDRPRFKSINDFLACLIEDAARIVGLGGYIAYHQEGSEASWRPRRYEFD